MVVSTLNKSQCMPRAGIDFVMGPVVTLSTLCLMATPYGENLFGTLLSGGLIYISTELWVDNMSSMFFAIIIVILICAFIIFVCALFKTYRKEKFIIGVMIIDDLHNEII